MVLTGITLQPERGYLDVLEPLFEAADYFEIAPETTWRVEAGEFVPNGFFHEFLEIATRLRRPCVAHGVGLSLGTADPADRPRQRRWLERIAVDHREFEFLWYTDHLGATVLGDRAVTLPIALPMNAMAAEVVRERLVELQNVIADVGFENSVFYFLLGEWLDEPVFFEQILTSPRMHMLLDLHNVYTMAINFERDSREYLERLDLSCVIEIHLAGGVRSDPAWLPSGKTFRLDSHDNAIPEEVWRLYEWVAPMCPNLRGVCVERMEGTVSASDLEGLRAELGRAKEVVRGRA